jgi:diguanylate cyclase (GGDEF)-like protein
VTGKRVMNGDPVRDHAGLVVCAALAALAVIVGVAGILAGDVALGAAAMVVGLAPAAAGVVIERRRQRAEESLLAARAQARHLHRRIERLQAEIDEDHALASEVRTPATPTADGLPPGTNTDDWEIDPVSGMLRERHLPVLLQQVVASARRKVHPVAVVFWELDGLDDASDDARDQAITALGAIAWRTLRESDAVFRLGPTTAIAVLVDTSESGAVIVAQRVRDALRSSPVGDALTVSAGIACYPSHALDAAELVSRAGRTLEAARADGYARDHVAVATAS